MKNVIAKCIVLPIVFVISLVIATTTIARDEELSIPMVYSQSFTLEEPTLTKPCLLIVERSLTPIKEEPTTEEIETISCSDYDGYEVEFLIDFVPEELDLLCQVIQAEARNQGTYGMYCVAKVIVNRCLSEQFPNTITDVLFSPGQFAVVTSGNYLNFVPTEETFQIVMSALDSYNTDDIMGATYFCTTAKDHKYATYLFTYDDHKFYK